MNSCDSMAVTVGISMMTILWATIYHRPVQKHAKLNSRPFNGTELNATISALQDGSSLIVQRCSCMGRRSYTAEDLQHVSAVDHWGPQFGDVKHLPVGFQCPA